MALESRPPPAMLKPRGPEDQGTRGTATSLLQRVQAGPALPVPPSIVGRTEPSRPQGRPCSKPVSVPGNRCPRPGREPRLVTARPLHGPGKAL